MNARQWYRFQNAAADPSVAELFIYGDIGASYWNDNAVTAIQCLSDLKALPATVSKIVVRVNSLGGSCFDAAAIANGLREQAAKGRTIETSNDGIAASAATVILMAGSVIRMADNAILMVHNPDTSLYGNAGEMRKTADTLDAIRNTIVATYQWHSSLSTEALIALMDAETWMDADTAIANGFATEKVEGLQVVASLDRRAFATRTIPEAFTARVDALLKPVDPTPAEPVVASATDVLTRVQAAGLDLAFASALVSAALPLEQVTARIATAKTEQAQSAARVAEIRALCATAKQADLADTFITGGLSVDGVRAALTHVTAQLDRVNPIDASLQPETGTATVRIDTAAVYAARNSSK
jgi:ATP-dependent protease ClpP protease subunit